MRQRHPMLAGVLLAALWARPGAGEAASRAAPPFPLWPVPREARFAETRLVGSPGPSDARPILLGVTAVEKPRVEDLR